MLIKNFLLKKTVLAVGLFVISCNQPAQAAQSNDIEFYINKLSLNKKIKNLLMALVQEPSTKKRALYKKFKIILKRSYDRKMAASSAQMHNVTQALKFIEENLEHIDPEAALEATETLVLPKEPRTLIQNDASSAGSTALGSLALESFQGSYNTAVGFNTLSSLAPSSTDPGGDPAGRENTAVGARALKNNQTGYNNTGIGFSSLTSNTSGYSNTACGSSALLKNTAGNSNTAMGDSALESNTEGDFNTALGMAALSTNSDGSCNTAHGTMTLTNNTSGSSNTAVGNFTMLGNTTGTANAALGAQALGQNRVGAANTACGAAALLNTTGSTNIGLGAGAGGSISTGSNNICIGNEGTSDDDATIRLGLNYTHTQCFIAGIRGSTVSGPAVLVNNDGKLGVATSSSHFKKDIISINNKEASLLTALNPVSFRYKDDLTGSKHYGLVAEEVNPIFPELVVRSHDGSIETILYHELPALLLAGYKQQQEELKVQRDLLNTLLGRETKH